MSVDCSICNHSASSELELEKHAAMHAREWRPIKTCPPGDVLLYNPKSGRSMPALIRVGYYGDWPNRKPTHWMPLPNPPKDSP